MTLKSLSEEYIDATRQTLNPHLFQRSDEDIVRHLKNIILSCQRDNPYFTIRVESFNLIDDYAEIWHTLERYYEDNGKGKGKAKTSKSKKRENLYSCIDINQSDIRLLVVNYYIRADGGKGSHEEKETKLQVLIAVPRIVDKYYCKINGIKRSILYQIVDGSTYNNGTSSQRSPAITMKTIFMAARFYKYYMDLVELHSSDPIKAVNYVTRMFSKRIQAPKYVFAKYGFYGGLEFFGINGIMVSDKPYEDDRYYNFERSKGYYVICPKILFDNDYVIQSIVCTIYQSIVPDTELSFIFDRDFWLRSLGADFTGNMSTKMAQILNSNDNIQDTLPKGYSVLDSFQSIFDLNGKESLRLPLEDKQDMYCILRWILREFNQLRLKDNLDISIKRIRFAEYIASMYAMKIAKGIYRVSDMNKRANVQNLVKALRTDPMYLLTAISRCRMVEYRNMTTDMDALAGLKFTYKGISGLGESGNQNIPSIYRYVHPSHVGRIDLDSSSDGDPGMKGIINPFVHIYEGGYFEENVEPNEWCRQFDEVVKEWDRVNNLIEPMEFQSKVLGIDISDTINCINEASYMAKQIIKPYIHANDGAVVPLEDMSDEEIFYIFHAGDGF